MRAETQQTLTETHNVRRAVTLSPYTSTARTPEPCIRAIRSDVDRVEQVDVRMRANDYYTLSLSHTQREREPERHAYQNVYWELVRLYGAVLPFEVDI